MDGYFTIRKALMYLLLLDMLKYGGCSGWLGLDSIVLCAQPKSRGLRRRQVSHTEVFIYISLLVL